MRNKPSAFRYLFAMIFPDSCDRKTFGIFFALSLFKILWFDYSWCASSTFRPFSYAETYIFAIILAATVNIPLVLFRSTRTIWVIDILLLILLVSNLVYFRTYYTAIPMNSYRLIGNMVDFTSSISGSLHLSDALFPLSTAVAWVASRRVKRPEKGIGRGFGIDKLKGFGRYLSAVAVFVLVGGALLYVKGGFRKAYESLSDAYTHTCGTPMYTIAGSVYYDYIREREVYTPETGQRIAQWIEKHTAGDIPAAITDDEARANCIIILLESFESWAMELTVEGQEITPYMNGLIRDSTTLYAPRTLPQVKGGRSIDAQLILNAGLLPINAGAYSLDYPRSFYPSIAGAMKEKYGDAHTHIYTGDRPTVWNQGIIAPALGYDNLDSKNDFARDESFGVHYRIHLGDASLLRQCAEKIRSDEEWKNKNSLLQIVTYSGHFPYTLPEDLRAVSFSDRIPRILSDYMTVANYTDHAVGLFVEAMRSDPKYDSTLIVITGDHAGITEMRDALYSDAAGRELLSPEPFTPLIILNMPASLRSNAAFDTTSAGIRYGKVMGQIDIYPLLLEALGLSAYSWKGVGRSITDSGKPGLALDAHGRLYGEPASECEDEIRLRDAWRISDEIIRYDYLRKVFPPPPY